jgi:hypothetical protein
MYTSGGNLLLTGWLREVCGKHGKFYQRGRACIEKVRWSVKLFITFPFASTLSGPCTLGTVGHWLQSKNLDMISSL